MASIKKLPSGMYRARIFIGRDAEGKQLFKSVTKSGERECKSAARKIEQDLEDKKFINIGNIKLVNWVDEWIKLNRDRLSPSTVGLYRIYSKAHYKPFFKQMKLSQVNEIHIRQFMAEKMKTLSPNTVRKLMSVLGKMLRDILKDKNPVKDIELPKKAKYSPVVPTTQEFNKLREIVRGTFDEPIILIAAWCGLRRGEIFALKPNDIDWNKGLMTVDESYAINDDYMYEYKPPKSDNGYRIVSVPDELMTILDTYYKGLGRVPEKLFDMRPDHYSDRFHAIIVNFNTGKEPEQKLPTIRFHDLRHYHATWLYEHDFPDQFAAKHMGHDIQTLKANYQHLGLSRTRDLDDKIKQIHNQNSQQNSQQT